MALDLNTTHAVKLKYIPKFTVGFSKRFNSLHSHGKQGDSNHNQIEDVEGVTAKRALVHKRSIDCHLSNIYTTLYLQPKTNVFFVFSEATKRHNL